MTEFVRDIQARYPTREEMDAYIAAGRQARSRAVRDCFVSIGAMLQRAVSTKRTVERANLKLREA